MNVLAILVFLAATLPMAGTRFKELPEGSGRKEVEAACFACHAADLLAQQRLTQKQWTAAVEKMVRWGAPLQDADKSVVIEYLSRHYGPKNRFQPVVSAPIGKAP